PSHWGREECRLYSAHQPTQRLPRVCPGARIFVRTLRSSGHGNTPNIRVKSAGGSGADHGEEGDPLAVIECCSMGVNPKTKRRNRGDGGATTNVFVGEGP